MTSRAFSKFVSYGGVAGPAMKVEYFSGADRYLEWVGFEWDRVRALTSRWWAEHGGAEPLPETVDEALGRISELSAVSEIRIEIDGKYWRITGRRFV